MSLSPEAEAEAEAAEVASVSDDEHKGKAVRIRWIDSGLALHGWQRMDALPKDTPAIETVGLWMGENERVVMVGGSRDADNDNWGECQLIWKPSITAKEWLA